MNTIKIVLALILGFGISSFVYELKKGNPPVKVYREGDALINVWENKSQEGKPYFSYQVQKEYEKNGELKKSSSFNEKELLDLKKIVDLAVSDIQAKK